MASAYSPMNLISQPNAERSGYLPDLGAAMMRGFKLQNEPKRMAEELRDMMLNNKINESKAKYAPQMEEASLQERLANAQRSQQLANQPYGGMLSGIAKEAYGIAQMTGQDPTDVANKLYKNKLDQAMALTQYRQGLTETQGTRTLSGLGKLNKEEQDIINNPDMDPNKKEELLGQYALMKQKTSTDSDTRKKNLLSSNIEKTIKTINPKYLTRFAGIKGSLDFRAQQAKAASAPGTESKAYNEYLKASQNAQFLAHQVRQFYGDSIQPAMLAKLEQLTNPGTWKNNPEIAGELYKSFTDLLGKETGTYRQALQNTNVYKGNEPLYEVKPGGHEGKSEAMYKDGVLHFIPSGDVTEAKSLGYTHGR